MATSMSSDSGNEIVDLFSEKCFKVCDNSALTETIYWQTALGSLNN